MNDSPKLIETRAGLAGMLEDLRRFPVIAVDTESNSLYAYRERVCLIQVSTPDTDYVVDTLALSDADVQQMAPFFADEAQEKVLHGADYDIATLRRDYDFEFGNVFDTMIASRTLGIQHFGLSNLLEERFGIQLNKKMQRHDWGKRPLQRDELEYARMDTHYLLPLRDQLLEELQAAGREREAREAFARVATTANWSRKEFDPIGFWNIKGALQLSDEERGVLRALYVMREGIAQRMDRPPFKVMSDQTMVSLAHARPRSLRALRAVPGISGWQIGNLGESIILAVESGLSDPQAPADRPAREGRPDDQVIERYERLRNWRKERAAQREVQPDVLVSNSQLMDIAHHAPATIAELRDAGDLGDFQLEAYGEEILDILRDGSR